MGVTLVLLAFDEKIYEDGCVSYWGQYLENITAIFPDFKSLDLARIDGAIGIFARRADDQQPVRELELSSFQSLGNKVMINFKVKANLEGNSGGVRRGLRNQLGKNEIVIDGPYLPFCCVVNTEDVKTILSTDGESQLSLMHSRLDWIGIHKKFEPIENLVRNHPAVWGDVEALNMIGFACAKLAETSNNLKYAFPDVRQKQDFLWQQARYRSETESIRRRCIELQPNNAEPWSTLAYLYYRNVIELTQPGGRRDGNVRDEINRAMEILNKTLELDNARVSDLYRRGCILADVLPKQILFGNDDGNSKERSDRSKVRIREGIDDFEHAVEVWETLTPANRNRKRYQKDYVKSLYHAGGAYYSLIINDWDEAFYMLELGKLLVSS